MKLITRLWRLMRINFILARYNIDEIVLGTPSFYPLRFFGYLNPYRWSKKSKLTRGQRIRLAIEELGPIFVKAGQIMSTRRDILPDDIALELAKLQDRVPPFSGEIAQKIIEEALGGPIKNYFAEFDTHALASASIAQVHAAKLLNGDAVVIKVLRPHVQKMIDRDVDLLMTLAKITAQYWGKARHFKPKEIVSEIAQTLYNELDLMHEAANAAQLKRNFANSKDLYIPKIYWDYCHSNILVLEHIHGIPVYDVERLRQSGVDLKKLAEKGIEIFFTQIFRDNFFHADLHPGNIFIDVTNPREPSYITVDFGIAGSLNQNDQRYIAENLIAFFKRDYQRVAELHIACGWLSPDTRIDQFEGAIRSVSEPILEQPLRNVSFGQLLLRLFQVARNFNVNIQPQLVLLQKTLLSIESLSRELAPDMNLWDIAYPQIERWLKNQVGLKAFLKSVRTNLPLWSKQLPDLPTLIYETLKERKEKDERIRFSHAVTGKENKKRETTIKIESFLVGVAFTLIVLTGIFYFIR